jgi:hypothetical protein
MKLVASASVVAADSIVWREMSMNQQETSFSNHGVLGRALEWLRVRFGSPEDLALLSREDLRELASDLAMGESDLISLSTSLRDNTVLMEHTIRARGFDPDQLRRSFASLMREVELVCSHCHATGRCLHELKAGTAVQHAQAFCPNAATFDDLLETSTSPKAQ